MLSWRAAKHQPISQSIASSSVIRGLVLSLRCFYGAPTCSLLMIWILKNARYQWRLSSGNDVGLYCSRANWLRYLNYISSNRPVRVVCIHTHIHTYAEYREFVVIFFLRAVVWSAEYVAMLLVHGIKLDHSPTGCVGSSLVIVKTLTYNISNEDIACLHACASWLVFSKLLTRMIVRLFPITPERYASCRPMSLHIDVHC